MSVLHWKSTLQPFYDWIIFSCMYLSFDVHFSYLQLLLIMWIRLSKTRIFKKICGKLSFLKAPHVWIWKNFCFKVNFTFWFLSSQTLEFFQTWIRPCVWALFSFLLGVTLLCYIATLCVNWGTPQNLMTIVCYPHLLATSGHFQLKLSK